MCVYIYVHKYSYIYLHISQNYVLTHALSLMHSLFALNFSVCLPLTLFHGFSRNPHPACGVGSKCNTLQHAHTISLSCLSLSLPPSLSLSLSLSFTDLHTHTHTHAHTRHARGRMGAGAVQGGRHAADYVRPRQRRQLPVHCSPKGACRCRRGRGGRG